MKSLTEPLKSFAVPLLVFMLFGLASGYVLQTRLLWALVAMLLVPALVVMLRWPELGTDIILFILYSNVAVALLRYRESGGIGGLDNGGLTTLDTGARAALLASVGVALVVPLCYYVWVERQRIVTDRPFLLMGFYLAALLLSAVFCRDPLLALTRIFRFVTEGLVLYFLVINVVRNRRDLRAAMWTLLIAGSLMAGLTVFQEASGTQKNIYWGMAQRGGVFAIGSNGKEVLTRTRAAGPIGEQNRYAQILLLLLPFTAFFFRYGETRMLRLCALGAGCLIFAGIVLTFSRGAFVALVVLLFAMALIRMIRWSHLVAVSVVAAVFVVIHEPDYLVRLRSLGQVGTLVTSNGRPIVDESATTRVAGNIASIQVFLDNPLIGVGPGVYAQYYATPAVYRLGVRQLRNYPSHNLYLNLAAESGILGLGLFMAIIISIAVELHRRRKLQARNDPELSDLAGCFLMVLWAYLASGMFAHLAFERYFWLHLALCAAAVRLIAPQVSTPQPGTEPVAVVAVI